MPHCSNGFAHLKSVYLSCRFGLSIHLYTRFCANMRTCYCNGVTSNPTGPAAFTRPGAGAGPPGVRSSAGGAQGRTSGWVRSRGAGPEASAEPGAGAARSLELQRKSRLAHQKRDFGYISGPGSTAAAASRAPAHRRRPRLCSNKSAPAEHLGGGAQIALCYKAQLSKATPRCRGS